MRYNEAQIAEAQEALRSQDGLSLTVLTHSNPKEAGRVLYSNAIAMVRDNNDGLVVCEIGGTTMLLSVNNRTEQGDQVMLLELTNELSEFENPYSEPLPFLNEQYARPLLFGRLNGLGGMDFELMPHACGELASKCASEFLRTTKKIG